MDLTTRCSPSVSSTARLCRLRRTLGGGATKRGQGAFAPKNRRRSGSDLEAGIEMRTRGRGRRDRVGEPVGDGARWRTRRRSRRGRRWPRQGMLLPDRTRSRPRSEVKSTMTRLEERRIMEGEWRRGEVRFHGGLGRSRRRQGVARSRRDETVRFRRRDGIVQRRRRDGERSKGVGVLVPQPTRRRRERSDRGESSRSRRCGPRGRRRWQGQEPGREVVRCERVGRLVHSRGILNETGCGRDRVRGPVLVLLNRRRYGRR